MSEFKPFVLLASLLLYHIAGCIANTYLLVQIQEKEDLENENVTIPGTNELNKGFRQLAASKVNQNSGTK